MRFRLGIFSLFFSFSMLASAPSVRAEPDSGCSRRYGDLAHGSGDATRERLDSLQAEISRLPQPFRWRLGQKLKKAMAPLAENAEPWQISRRVAAIQSIRKSTNLLRKLSGRMPAASGPLGDWVERSALHEGLVAEFRRRGLVFNPEEKSRLTRLLLRLGRSRALAFIWNPTELPSADLDLVPPGLLEKVLANGLDSEQAELEKALQASPARFHALKQDIGKLVKVALVLLGGYRGHEIYVEIKAKQGEAEEKARQSFFGNLNEIEEGVNELEAEINELKRERAKRSRRAP